jgi:hypothetical protein
VRNPLPFLLPIGVVFLAYAGLVGAAQLPEHTGLTIVAAWVLPAVVLMWIRTETGNLTAPGIGDGMLLLLFGPFLSLYHLIRSRRRRHWGLSVMMGVLLFSVPIGYLGGQTIISLKPIPPRYVEWNGDVKRVTPRFASEAARTDFEWIAAFLADEESAGRQLPTDADDLYARWMERRPQDRLPFDLFTGLGYYYERRDAGYGLWSAGPDRTLDTDDDLWFVWPDAKATMR